MCKKCSKCNQDKSFDEFNKRTKSKDGLRFECKLCQSKSGKNYRFTNNKKTKLANSKWYTNNRERVLKEDKIYYIENRDKIIKRQRKYNKSNGFLVQKKYREKSPHLIAWRRILNNSLRSLNKKKETTTIKLLGYSAGDLKQHIETLFTEGMSWNNYGEWHIDHKIGVINYPKDTHPSIVNALSNLRPLWATTREINGIIYEGNLNRSKFI